MREIFYYPDSNVVDHTRMPSLLLRDGDFSRMMNRVLGRFEGMAEFTFANNQFLHQSAERMIENSNFTGRKVGKIFSTAGS